MASPALEDYALRVTQVRDIELRDGRSLRVHDSGASEDSALTLLWHHGSPQTGALLEPLLHAAAVRNIRLLSYARPGYGGSTAKPGRDVVSAATDVEQLLDALGIDRFATMGASGGGPHALACAAILQDRMIGVVCIAGIAPFTEDFDWFEGMASPGSLQAARHGREARALFAETEEFDPASFIAADWAALEGEWRSLGADAGAAGETGPDGLIDDDTAFASDWGFDLAAVTAPTLLVKGGRDRVVPAAHAEWMLRQIPHAELWQRPNDGHVSVLAASPVAMDWVIDKAVATR